MFLGKTAFICGQAENFLHVTHNELCGNNVMRETILLEGHLQGLKRSEILGKYFHLRVKCVEYLGREWKLPHTRGCILALWLLFCVMRRGRGRKWRDLGKNILQDVSGLMGMKLR